MIFKVPGKRKLLAQVLHTSRVYDLARLWPESTLSVFNFHRIRGDNHSTEYDETVYGPHVDVFRKHMTWLAKYADAVSEGDLISHIKSGTPLPKRGFMITFDDGYRDNYDLAKPVLNDLKIPGFFFVPTLAIEDRVLGWWDDIWYLLKKTKKRTFQFRGETIDNTQPVAIVSEIFTLKMKHLGADASETLVFDLSEACEVDLPTRAQSDKEFMTWDQLRDADRSGITIGSHTHTHRVLATLDLETQRQELALSSSILEKQLGKKPKSFAYPVGGYEHFNTETVSMTQECGYDLAFSFLTGVNRAGSIQGGDIKRVDFQQSESIYEGVLSMPWVFGTRTCALPATQSKSQR